MKRALILAVLGLVGATQLSCNVNDYCLNCGKGDGGGSGDANGDGNGSGIDGGSDDGGQCVPTNGGVEICDGKDNDCNGTVDDNAQGVGQLCTNQMGECAGGVQQCTNGMLKCSKQPVPEICDTKDNDCNGLTDEGDPGGGGKCGTDVGECIAGTNHCVGGSIQCVGFVDHTGDAELCNLKDDNCNGQYDEGLTNMGSCGIKTCVNGTNNGTICSTSADCTGGGTCASNVGECHLGTLSCLGGTPSCDANMLGYLPHLEICDNKDNDCDGATDEGFNTQTDPQNCGMCGHVCTVGKTCIGGTNPGTGCAVAADCTGGGTCTVTAVATCSTVPAAGTCGYTCNAGYVDLDGLAANGCEYQCFASGVEVCDGLDNDCDGLVDMADPDLGAAPSNICLSAGECATGTTVSCDGGSGWTCHYNNTNVSKDLVTGAIIPETACDGLDNDCNGIVDDHQRPLLGTACDDGKLGECKSSGTYQCGTPNTGPAVCMYTTIGKTALPESCDAKDNDCDGVIDDTPTPGTYAKSCVGGTNPGAACAAPADCTGGGTCEGGGIEWINIGGGRQMMKYEASKSDSSPTDGGNVVTNQCGGSSTVAANGATESGTTVTITTTGAHNLAVGKVVVIAGVSVAGYNGTFSVTAVPTATTFQYAAASGLGTGSAGTVSPVCPTCSTASRMPWTNVTYPQAVAACAAVGATLCSEQAWHRACSVVPSLAYPIALPSSGTVDKLVEAEDYKAIGYATDSANSITHSWVEDYTAGFSGISDMQANPDSGSDIAPGSVLANAPYLEYQFNFQKTTSSYHIWARMYSRDNTNNRVAVSIDGATPGTGDQISTGSNNAWVWAERSGSAVTIAQGVHTIRIYMQRDAVRLDAIEIRDSGGTPATPANGPGFRWAYATSQNTYQSTTCNGHDYDATQDTTLATGSLASCYADDGMLTGGTTNDHGFDMSGNVKEWTLAHQPGQNPIRGGSSNNTDVGISCPLNFTLGNDSFFFPNVGFRCCR